MPDSWWTTHRPPARAPFPSHAPLGTTPSNLVRLQQLLLLQVPTIHSHPQLPHTITNVARRLLWWWCLTTTTDVRVGRSDTIRPPAHQQRRSVGGGGFYSDRPPRVWLARSEGRAQYTKCALGLAVSIIESGPVMIRASPQQPSTTRHIGFFHWRWLRNSRETRFHPGTQRGVGGGGRGTGSVGGDCPRWNSKFPGRDRTCCCCCYERGCSAD